MRDFTQKYSVYTGEDIEIVKDYFDNVIIETSNYGITYIIDICAIIIYNIVTEKLIILKEDKIPDFMKPLLNFSELKCGQDVNYIVDKFFNLKVFL